MTLDVDAVFDSLWGFRDDPNMSDADKDLANDWIDEWVHDRESTYVEFFDQHPLPLALNDALVRYRVIAKMEGRTV